MKNHRMIYASTVRFDFTNHQLEILKALANGAVLNVSVGTRASNLNKVYDVCKSGLKRKSCILMGGINRSHITPSSNSVANLINSDTNRAIFTSECCYNGGFHWILSLKSDFRQHFIENFMSNAESEYIQNLSTI